jgi:hypothetical protein
LSHFNAAWEALDEAFTEVVPDCKTIRVDPSKMIGWTEHPWGVGYVHYIPDFYEEFLVRLTRLWPHNQKITVAARTMAERKALELRS